MTPELDRRRFLKLAGATAIVAACGGASTAPSAAPSASTAASAAASATAKAMDFMKKLHPNILSYGPTSPGVITSISNGEAAGAPNWSHDILTEKAKDPTRIDLTVPKDTGFEVGAVSIVKGTKNLLGAQAFVDWVLTKDAGDLNTKLSNRGSVRTDVAPAPGAPTLTSVTLVNYDRQWATDNKTRIQKLWQTTVGIQ